MKLLALGIGVLFMFRVAYAVDPVPLKDGLWSIHTIGTFTRQGPSKPLEGTMSLCADRSTAMQMPGNPADVKDCKTISRSSTGDTTITEAQCTVKGTVVRIKETVTMKGENEAHTIIQSTFAPPMYGITNQNSVADMKYAGPCPKGMKPGDVAGPDGKVIQRAKP